MIAPFRRSSEQTDGVAPIVLTHASGPVTLNEVHGRIADGLLELRGLIDDDTWERIQRHDVFGATSRLRSPGELPSSGTLRITLTTGQELPPEAVELPAEVFIIVDAMRSVDVEDLQDAGLEGEVWEGIRFAAPPVWGAALAELVADGFAVLVGDHESALLRSADDLATVQFHLRHDVKLVQIVVSSPLGLADDVPLALYEAINGINMAVPWSTTMIDDGDVLVRETVADATADQGAVITLRTQEMLGLLWVMRGPLAEVAQGRLTPEACLKAMFS